MAKHRRQTITARRVAAASAALASASVLTPGVADAAEVVIPNTNYSGWVEGIENIPGIENVPGADQWIPSLSEQGASSVQGSAIAAPASSVGQQIVAAARSKTGAPYGWGSAGPNAFDCSGLTSWAYAQVGKQIPRTSQAQAAQGTPVSLDALQPGDIVAYYGGASHVGIYVGNGMIIDSLNEGTTVQERPLDYMPVHSAVRF